MDREGFVHRRKRRYVGFTLTEFERLIENRLPRQVRENLQSEIDEFKGIVRGKLNALAIDANDVHSMTDMEFNAAADELRDHTATPAHT